MASSLAARVRRKQVIVHNDLQIRPTVRKGAFDELEDKQARLYNLGQRFVSSMNTNFVQTIFGQVISRYANLGCLLTLNIFRLSLFRLALRQ